MRNLTKILAFSTLIYAVFVGCSPKTPNCSAQETKDLVLQIIKEQDQKFGISKTIFQGVSIDTIDTIRTINHDKENDKYKCAAKLVMTNKIGEILEADIEYNVEQTDDHQQFIVSIDNNVAAWLFSLKKR